ncbi:hypothetical protein GS495_13000 [Rhodococcus hoagii]|nr:hypothetical protein [Prescottella equi]
MARTFMRRWFSGGPDDDPAAISGYNAMTTAFLQTDRLLADIEDGVAAARDTDPAGTVTYQWGPVREMHAQATSTYLELQRPHPESPYQPAAVYQDCTRALEQVSAEMTAFRDRFGERLARARAAKQVAVGAVQQARVAANQAVTALDRPEGLRFLQYPSVMAAVDVLAAQVRTLDTVTDTARQREVAAAVTDAAAAVHAALAAAPGRETEAQNAVRSIATRISAVATRAEQIGPARSALLREFSAACSNDLVDNDRLPRPPPLPPNSNYRRHGPRSPPGGRKRRWRIARTPATICGTPTMLSTQSPTGCGRCGRCGRTPVRWPTRCGSGCGMRSSWRCNANSSPNGDLCSTPRSTASIARVPHSKACIPTIGLT